MVKIIGIVAGIIVVIIGGIVGIALTKPDTLQVEREIVIQADPQVVFSAINDLHQWNAWSPWDKLDPAMKKRFVGPAAGVGAIYEWEGNSKVGQGRMEIIDSNAPTYLKIQLDFIKPFKATNTTDFTLIPVDNGTRVTWRMMGENSFMSKVMSVFMDMDKMIGKDFETGLANLKAIAE